MLKILSLGFEEKIPEEFQCVASGIQGKALALGKWPCQQHRGLHKGTAYITETVWQVDREVPVLTLDKILPLPGPQLLLL